MKTFNNLFIHFIRFILLILVIIAGINFIVNNKDSTKPIPQFELQNIYDNKVDLKLTFEGYIKIPSLSLEDSIASTNNFKDVNVTYDSYLLKDNKTMYNLTIYYDDTSKLKEISINIPETNIMQSGKYNIQIE